MKNYCSKCKVRIVTHLWIVREEVFCSASCQRGKDSAFDKTVSAIKKMRSTEQV